MRLSTSLTKAWLGVMALLAAVSAQAANGQITTRNWEHMAVVTLNPERDQPVAVPTSPENFSIKVA